MAVFHPTHVVTLTVWDAHRAETRLRHWWIAGGPFDSAETVTDCLETALAALADGVELVETKSTYHRKGTPPWEQLEIF